MSASPDDYLALVTSEHRDKPKFAALIKLLCGYAADDRNLLESLPAKFDVDTAVGVQLDDVGLWAGVGRTVTVIPSEAFPTPPDPYQVQLDDDVFRRLIKARVLANRWDGTPEQLVDILVAFFGPAGSSAAEFDNQDMSIDLYIAGTFPTAAEAAIFSQFILPVRPVTVRVRTTWISPTGGPLFALDFETLFLAGPDVGGFGLHF